MARPTSKAIAAAAVLMLASAPAVAQNYDYLSRSDSISLSAGEANAANTVIQTPTPWPWYVNQTHIHRSAVRGVKAINNYYSGTYVPLPDMTSGQGTGIVAPTQ